MFFGLSKILWTVLSPLTLITLMAVIGIVWQSIRPSRIARTLLSAGIILLGLGGFLPIGSNIIIYLEAQEVAPDPLPEKIDGIVVLGGAINSEKSVLYNQIDLNDRAERLTEMVRLSKLYPQARVVYSGGDGSLRQSSGKESESAAKLLDNMGLSVSNIVFEDKSRNTYENAKFSYDLVTPQVGENWLLVTSAFHMPRSKAVFNKLGWEVIPYPAGYLENGDYLYWPSLDVLGNFYKLQVATKEIVGIIAYSLTSKL